MTTPAVLDSADASGNLGTDARALDSDGTAGGGGGDVLGVRAPGESGVGQDPTPRSPQLSAETLLAVTGLWPKGDHPNAADELASAGIVETYGNRLKRWLRRYDADDYKPREFDCPEPPSEEALQKRILDPMDEEESARLRSGLHNLAEADAYVALVQRGRTYLDSKWPKVPVPGITADVFPLSQEELYDVHALVRVLDNPDVLFDEMEAESLTIPMVDAWREVYPSMAAEVDRIFDKLVIDRLAARKSLTWQQTDLYRMLRGIPLDATIEVKQDAPKQNASAQQQQKQGVST